MGREGGLLERGDLMERELFKRGFILERGVLNKVRKGLWERCLLERRV
jgi:hypothetical protein